MFYARDFVAADAAHAGGTSVAVSVTGARSGRRVSSAYAAGASGASERSGGEDACHLSGLCPLRAFNGLPGCAADFVVGAFRTPTSGRAALPLPGLRPGMPTSSGPAGRGTGAHQRIA